MIGDMLEDMAWGYLTTSEREEIGWATVQAINRLLMRDDVASQCRAAYAIKHELDVRPAMTAAVLARRAAGVARVAAAPMSDATRRALALAD